MSLKTPKKKKSRGAKSEERRGQGMVTMVINFLQTVQR